MTTLNIAFWTLCIAQVAGTWTGVYYLRKLLTEERAGG